MAATARSTVCKRADGSFSMIDRSQLQCQGFRTGVGVMGIAILVAAASAACPDVSADSTSPKGPAAKSAGESVPSAAGDENARPRPVDTPEAAASVSSESKGSTESKDDNAKESAKDVAKDDQVDDQKKKDAKPSPVRSIRRESEGFDLLPGVAFETDSSPQLAAACRAIRTAQVHLRLGVAEHGNISAFEAAREVG
jgi:hypothetical protein